VTGHGLVWLLNWASTSPDFAWKVKLISAVTTKSLVCGPVAGLATDWWGSMGGPNGFWTGLVFGICRAIAVRQSLKELRSARR
jgi:hypothetical protein